MPTSQLSSLHSIAQRRQIGPGASGVARHPFRAPPRFPPSHGMPVTLLSVAAERLCELASRFRRAVPTKSPSCSSGAFSSAPHCVPRGQQAWTITASSSRSGSWTATAGSLSTGSTSGKPATSRLRPRRRRRVRPMICCCGRRWRRFGTTSHTVRAPYRRIFRWPTWAAPSWRRPDGALPPGDAMRYHTRIQQDAVLTLRCDPAVPAGLTRFGRTTNGRSAP